MSTHDKESPHSWSSCWLFRILQFIFPVQRLNKSSLFWLIFMSRSPFQLTIMSSKRHPCSMFQALRDSCAPENKTSPWVGSKHMCEIGYFSSAVLLMNTKLSKSQYLVYLSLYPAAKVYILGLKSKQWTGIADPIYRSAIFWFIDKSQIFMCPSSLPEASKSWSGENYTAFTMSPCSLKVYTHAFRRKSHTLTWQSLPPEAK